jgi:hypothetical protein
MSSLDTEICIISDIVNFINCQMLSFKLIPNELSHGHCPADTTLHPREESAKMSSFMINTCLYWCPLCMQHC